MKRWHEEINITRRQWQEHRQLHVESNKWRGIGYGFFQRQPGSDPVDVDCMCDAQMGRFRKRDAYDCANPRCFICHGDKFPRRKPTTREQLAGLWFKEQLRDLWEGDR